MIRSELLGQHEHVTRDGQRVQIWFRDGKYLARARYSGRQIGETLGTDPHQATCQLRRILTEMENGTYVSGRDRRRRELRCGPVPQHDLRGLIDAYLHECRRLKGPNTTRDYCNRLMHVLDFAELPAHLKRWRLARDIDRGFAVELRAFLHQRDVTANGRAGTTHKMSPKMIRLVLESVRAALTWAARADVRHLPAEFVNPFREDIIGPKLQKDPLRACPLPIESRIRMVQQMDAWQLVHLSPLLVLPTRFEDVSGAIISDFNFASRSRHLGSRCGGSDYNKGRADMQMPLPEALLPLLRIAAAGRMDGPMFRTRADWTGRQKRRMAFQNQDEFAALCSHAIARAKPTDVATEQGRKKVIRQVLLDCGAVSTKTVYRELRQLMNSVGIGKTVRPYDVRASMTTEMHRAGIRHLELRYLTMHSPNDILNDYASLEPEVEMAKYFVAIEPLLTAITQRAVELGCMNTAEADLPGDCSNPKIESDQ